MNQASLIGMMKTNSKTAELLNLWVQTEFSYKLKNTEITTMLLRSTIELVDTYTKSTLSLVQFLYEVKTNGEDCGQ